MGVGASCLCCFTPRPLLSPDFLLLSVLPEYWVFLAQTQQK